MLTYICRVQAVCAAAKGLNTPRRLLQHGHRAHVWPLALAVHQNAFPVTVETYCWPVKTPVPIRTMSSLVRDSCWNPLIECSSNAAEIWATVILGTPPTVRIKSLPTWVKMGVWLFGSSIRPALATQASTAPFDCFANSRILFSASP